MKKPTRFFFLLMFIIIAILQNACQQDNVENDQINTYEQFIEIIKDPPTAYRSAPLWDWNEKITHEGIDLHMEEFKKAGIGGVFIHPRPGLITEYLSENWHQLFDYTVQKGKELGMEIHITGSLKNTFGYFYEPNDRVLHGPHVWNLAPEKKPGLDGMYLMDYGLFDAFEVYGHVEN